MKIISIIINVFLLAVVILLFIKGDFWDRSKNFTYTKLDVKDKYNYKMNKFYKIKTDQFMSYNVQAKISMLGDSMTEFTHWNELLGRKDVVNRGISGDITEGMLNRLENIIKVQPKYCFFMGGINDIIYNVSYEKTIDNIESITKELRQEGITPVLQTIIYTGRSFRNCQTINILVARLNEGIKIIAEKNSCFYLDINNGLTEQGILKDQFTYDGLHLNAEGYKVWGCFISEFLISQEE